MSSGDVSSLTKITFLPKPTHSFTACGVKTIYPTAAPGEALSPFPKSLAFFLEASETTLCKSWLRLDGLILKMASCFYINPS